MNSNTQKVSWEKNASVYINVMESLVSEEIDKQLRFYPKSLKAYLNLTEVATYALNRLPPLYASSTIGAEAQKRTASHNYRSDITSVVRRAIAAVERDPLRNSTPIISEVGVKYQKAENALGEIQQLLQQYNLLDFRGQEINWDNCTKLLRKAIQKLSRKVQLAEQLAETKLSSPPPPLKKGQTPNSDVYVNSKSTLW